MIKKTLYTKTKRFGNTDNYVLTEKMDGSNLSFYKKDESLYIAQRNNIYQLSSIDENKDKMYKGLYGWLKEYGNDLEERLNSNSCVAGEWLGMGSIKYGDFTYERFLMFAKANVNVKHEMYGVYYDFELFNYPFKQQMFPEYIGTVPLVETLSIRPTVEYLDARYEQYSAEQNRKVEGFIVTDGYSAEKYVRFKSGKLEDHRI